MTFINWNSEREKKFREVKGIGIQKIGLQLNAFLPIREKI